MHKSVGTGFFTVPLALALAACSDDGTPATGGSTGEGTTSGSTSGEPASTTNIVPTTTQDPSTTSTSEASTTDNTTGPPPPVCGDGTVDPDEECDDGPANADDAACTADCKTNICGDGLVLAGTEECDDGNTDDTDDCVTGCKLAFCGDTFVQMGLEMCDDGNDVDDDACSNACVMASCGDGVVQMGEACDDSNTDDTDDCTTLCQVAACGDGFLQAGVEMCDDGNADDTDDCVAGCVPAACGDGFVLAGTEDCDDANPDETDACTTLCKAPACDDGIISGTESDLDCGGDCMTKCTDGLVCNAPADCASNACIANVCAPPRTCKDLLAGDPTLPNGKYPLDLDGEGPIVMQDVYCDMTTNGGGWTVFYATSGADNEQPLVSNVEVPGGDPLAFQHYNLDRAKKVALSANSTETLFLRHMSQGWLKFNSPAFDPTLLMAMKFAKKPITLTANNGISAPAFFGWSNFNINGGGDFGITQSPDMVTCNPNMQNTGFDHHDNRYYMVNCQCKYHYLYSYSNGPNGLDADAGYDASLGFGSWNLTVNCQSAEGGTLVFYAAMR